MCGLYVDYIVSVVECIMCNMEGIFVQEHVSIMWNVSMTVLVGIDCTEFVWGIYTDKVVWNLHMK